MIAESSPNRSFAPETGRIRRAYENARSSSRLPLIILIAGLLISLAVKLASLNSRDLWLDETYSAFVSGLSFKDCFRAIAGDVHPPLYYLLLWGWVRVAGNGQAALRLLSVLLSTWGTIGMYAAARAWMGARAGALAALLFAFSPLLFVYSLEVRMYMLAVCCVTVLLALHAGVTSGRSPSALRLVLYAIFSALLFYTHYVGVFVLLGLFVDWLLASGFRRRELRHFFLTAALTAVLVGPWIPVMLRQRAQKIELNDERAASMKDPSSLLFGGTVDDPGARGNLLRAARNAGSVIGFFPGPPAALALLCALPLAIMLLGISPLLLRGDRVSRLFVIASLSVAAGLIILGLNTSRYLLPLLPFLFLLMGRVTQWFGSTDRRTVGYSAAILVVFVYLLGFARQASVEHPHPWRNLVRTLQRDARPDDLVVFSALYGQVPFDYFASQAGAVRLHEDGFPEPIYAWWARQPFKGWGGPVATRSDLQSAGLRLIREAGSKTIWLVAFETNYYDPNNALLGSLGGSGNATEVSLPFEASSEALGDHIRLFRIAARGQSE